MLEVLEIKCDEMRMLKCLDQSGNTYYRLTIRNYKSEKVLISYFTVDYDVSLMNSQP